MGTAIKHPVPDQVKLSFVIFHIWAILTSALSLRVPGCQKLILAGWHDNLNPLWQHRMLYSCTHVAMMGVNELTFQPNVWLVNAPGVPRWQPHRCSGLANLPFVGAVPSHHILV